MANGKSSRAYYTYYNITLIMPAKAIFMPAKAILTSTNATTCYYNITLLPPSLRSSLPLDQKLMDFFKLRRCRI